MIIETFVKGPLENNNYLLIDEVAKEAVLIDCTEPADDIMQSVKQYGAKLKFILLTHVHFDHIMGVNYFRDKYGVKTYAPKEDNFMFAEMNNLLGRFNLPATEVQKADRLLEDGEILNFGNYNIEVIHTPGHTKGGVCYLIDDKLFSGDTIFYESLGRTDLIGGSDEDMENSLRKIFNMLPDATEIYPGHADITTVAHEKEFNNIFED